MVMDESIEINGQELLLALAIPSECNLGFIIGGFSTVQVELFLRLEESSVQRR